MSLMQHFRKYRNSLLAAIIFAAFTLTCFGIYTSRTLQGDVNNHILAGEMFGTPAELKAHGIKPFFHGDGQTGWDGQFYYYMSNDILGIKDTASHIDSPSYRYQRIGLSLYVATLAALTGRDWVSPVAYFTGYFILLLVASFVGARLLELFGAHPRWVLVWALSIGTQITLFNALPDGAADAFLIIALGLLFSGRLAWSVVPFILSGLSREVYVLFPSFILLLYFLKAATRGEANGTGRIRSVVLELIHDNRYLLLLPGALALAWRFYITHHFGQSPSSQATGILGLPFAAWYDSISAAFSGRHPHVYGLNVSREIFSLLLFVLLVGLVILIAVRFLRNARWSAQPEMAGVAMATISLGGLYLCFGPTVMSLYTGYLKASAVFFFLIPLFLAINGVAGRMRTFATVFLITGWAFTTEYNLSSRVLEYSDNYEEFTQRSQASDMPPIACFDSYQARLEVKDIRLRPPTPLVRFFGGAYQVVLDVDVTNTGKYPFWSSKNTGGVFMSYQWLTSERKMVLDGIRSVIPGGLRPGETKRVSIISRVPRNVSAVLVPSPVQEGCSWFYVNNPAMSAGIKIEAN